jgi:hypothetical protein
MSVLLRQPRRAQGSRVAFHTSVDQSAEREAEAIDRLAELLDEPVAMTRLQQARLEAICAAERGLPPVRPICYNRIAAMKEFDRLARGGVPRPFNTLTIRADKRQRLQRRINRFNRLNELQKLPKGPPVPFEEACKLMGVGQRTLSRAIERGDIKPLRVANWAFFQRKDLPRVLSRVLLRPNHHRRGCIVAS